MDRYVVRVEDSPVVKTFTINTVIINIMRLDLFRSLTMNASTCQDTKIVDNTMIVMEGADYDAWGNNDQYVIDYVLNKLGLTEIPGLTIKTTYNGM